MEPNQELKLDNIEIHNNFLKNTERTAEKTVETKNSDNTENSEQFVHISAFPNSSNFSKKKRLKNSLQNENKFTINDLNNLKTNLQNEKFDEPTQFSMIEKTMSRMEGKEELNKNLYQNTLSSLGDSITFEDGKFKLPDGPLDLPFFI